MQQGHSSCPLDYPRPVASTPHTFGLKYSNIITQHSTTQHNTAQHNTEEHIRVQSRAESRRLAHRTAFLMGGYTRALPLLLTIICIHVAHGQIIDNSGTSQGIWEKIWETLQKQFHQSPQTHVPSAADDAQTVSVSQRRRALLKHTLSEHYRRAATNAGSNSSGFNASIDHTSLLGELYHSFLHQSSLTVHQQQSPQQQQQQQQQARELKNSHLLNLQSSFPVFPESLRQSNREKIREMFQHAYDSYMYYAWPHGEVRPVCMSAVYMYVCLFALQYMLLFLMYSIYSFLLLLFLTDLTCLSTGLCLPSPLCIWLQCSISFVPLLACTICYLTVLYPDSLFRHLQFTFTKTIEY
jgi:hypothetical protein